MKKNTEILHEQAGAAPRKPAIGLRACKEINESCRNPSSNQLAEQNDKKFQIAVEDSNVGNKQRMKRLALSNRLGLGLLAKESKKQKGNEAC